MVARLSSMENAALAVFKHGADRCIMVGNIREEEIDVAEELLVDEATDFFGSIIAHGNQQGSRPGRMDAFVEVSADDKQVLRFVKERLGGSDNQMI